MKYKMQILFKNIWYVFLDIETVIMYSNLFIVIWRQVNTIFFLLLFSKILVIPTTSIVLAINAVTFHPQINQSTFASLSFYFWKDIFLSEDEKCVMRGLEPHFPTVRIGTLSTRKSDHKRAVCCKIMAKIKLIFRLPTTIISLFLY